MDKFNLPEIEAKTDRDILITIATGQHYLREDIEEVKVDVKKQNGRLRSLEDWKTKILGGGAVLVLIGSPVIALGIASIWDKW